jgi:membrane protein implicated in regulation of membrane protease activity
MTILPLHITGGVLALVFGYVALFAAKGATVVLLPVAVMLYWLWRIRVRQPLHGLVRVSAPRATALERF